MADISCCPYSSLPTLLLLLLEKGPLLNTFFHKLGIIHRVSCPHTHQQQGCVERKHRHIINTTLALLAESHVPKTFWDEACQTGKLHAI